MFWPIIQQGHSVKTHLLQKKTTFRAENMKQGKTKFKNIDSKVMWNYFAKRFNLSINH